MSFGEFTRGPASARLLIGFGQEHGVPAARLLAGTRLAAGQLDDPNLELAAAQELCIARNLLRLLKHPPGLGLQVGCRYTFSVHGMLGYGLISSETVGDALTLALRFLPLSYAFTSITYHEHEHGGVLRFGELDHLADDIRQFLVERDMAAAAVLLRDVLGGDIASLRFAFRGDEPRPAYRPSRAWPTALGTEHEFSARFNSLSFERSLLSRALPHANPVTASMCEQMCAQLMESRRARTGTAAAVRHHLSAAGAALPDLGRMARLMNVSERTLKRRLSDEGVTFRELLAEARRSAAESLLGADDLTLTEIAGRLGYSDLSSFSQAFKRRHGITPSAFRKRVRN
ncbi:AraC family transcriptional regulator [Burkholderia vietnamiensis]|uniref:AraC family transcriptional regulator n=1 Tax=Burkholderia vietnamiensis TaxID=60552 RepID=UPI00158C0283|nr:AraC family transcriptional regulator [Burkholderia vietnamiensis]